MVRREPWLSIAAAIAAGRSGAAPVHDGHVCSGVVSGRGWGGRYRGGAARVAEQFFALLLRSTGGSEWVRWFCSVLLLLLCSSHREREGGRGREREREGSMLRRDFNIPFGDSAKKTYIPLGFAYVEANNINI